MSNNDLVYNLDSAGLRTGEAATAVALVPAEKPGTEYIYPNRR